MKKQEKICKEMEISHLLDKEFKEIIIRVLTKLESGIQNLKTTTNKIQQLRRTAQSWHFWLHPTETNCMERWKCHVQPIFNPILLGWGDWGTTQSWDFQTVFQRGLCLGDRWASAGFCGYIAGRQVKAPMQIQPVLL